MKAKAKQIPFRVGLSPVNQAVIREVEAGRAMKASHAAAMKLPAGSPWGKQK
jgi:hypothetical protein